VNARQAEILVQLGIAPASHTTTTASDPAAGAHLFSWHYPRFSLGWNWNPGVHFQCGQCQRGGSVGNRSGNSFTRERRNWLEDRHVLPLVVLPEYVGLAKKVRDWIPARWGEWRLADVCA